LTEKKVALHLIGEFEGEIVAHSRLFQPGISFDYASIGRVTVSPKYRDRKWGHELMGINSWNCVAFYESNITIGAQLYLKNSMKAV
jgi:ElaA protein